MSIVTTKMASANRTWAMVNKHIPMIKFRKTPVGGIVKLPVYVLTCMAGLTVQLLNPTQSVPLDKITINKPTVSIVIEDWQITGKYKRQPISQEEIDFINRGGPQ